MECKLKVKLPDENAKKVHARLVGDYALSSPSHVNGKQRVWKQVQHGTLLRGIDIKVNCQEFCFIESFHNTF